MHHPSPTPDSKPRPPAPPPLLEVRNLHVHFPVRHTLFQPLRQWVNAVDGVSLTLAPGETLGLVGESGCGKTTLGRAILRLTPITRGSVRFEGREISTLPEPQVRPLRRGFQMIFQDPFGSLNPQMRISQIIGEALDIHHLTPNPHDRQHRILELLESVGLSRDHAERYPHEFSGGQRQRIGIARSLAVQPRLIICDEPVSALDVSVQAQIINLLQDLREQHGLAYLFIAHDLAVVGHISQRIAVMYLGRIVETAPAPQLISSPRHPYTQALLSAVPVIDPTGKPERTRLPGDVPSPIDPPAGCPFHPRCPLAEARCRIEPPTLSEISARHSVACHLAV